MLKVGHVLCLLVLLCVCLQESLGNWYNPLVSVAHGLKSLGNQAVDNSAYYQNYKCRVPLGDNVQEIHRILNHYTCGQEAFVSRFVSSLSSLTEGYYKSRPKARVYTWHGTTGIGKTSLLEKLGEHSKIYRLTELEEMNSKNIVRIATRCKYPIVVLEDVDRFGSQVGDQVYELIDGAYASKQSKAVFILTMNSGSNGIFKFVTAPGNTAMTTRYTGPQHRNKYGDGSMHRALMNDIASEMKQKQSFWNDLVSRGMITEKFIWLPLGLREVQCCAKHNYMRMFSDIHMVSLNHGEEHVKVELEGDIDEITAYIAGEADYIEKNGQQWSILGCRGLDRHKSRILEACTLKVMENEEKGIQRVVCTVKVGTDGLYAEKITPIVNKTEL